VSVQERLDRLERAFGELTHMLTGPHGLHSLRAQAPTAAGLYEELLARTRPTGDTFVGRVENTDAARAPERR
jgi:hypothetical protein